MVIMVVTIIMVIMTSNDSKELVLFPQLVKVRRGKLVLALPSIRFYQIIFGTKYE